MPNISVQDTCVVRTENQLLALSAAYLALHAYTDGACDSVGANDTDILNWTADLVADLRLLVDALGADWGSVTRLSETYHRNER